METFFSGLTVLLPMLLIFAVVAAVFGWIWLAKVRKQALLEHGHPAEAEILEVWHTGLIVNQVNIQIGLRLQVRPSLLPPYEIKTHTYISRLDPIVYRPGMILDVRYDPDNHKRVAIAGINEGPVNGISDPDLKDEQIYSNGRLYRDLDELPEADRARYRQLMSLLGDEDQDGIPDVLDMAVVPRSNSSGADTPVEEGIEAVETLRNLKAMLESDLITRTEYDAKKEEILARM
jgi:hypothetical protein